GAAAYLTAQQPVGGTAIRVRDTAAALLSLGALARDRVGGAIGITGSVGKTTTKDLLAGCLASTFRTAASEGSFNNELGLPLTLLGAPEAARWVVLEMGVRRGCRRRRAGRRRHARPGPMCTVSPVVAVGADRGPAGVARRAPGGQRAGGGDGRAVVWGPHRDRGLGIGGEPGLALAHGRPS